MRTLSQACVCVRSVCVYGKNVWMRRGNDYGMIVTTLRATLSSQLSLAVCFGSGNALINYPAMCWPSEKHYLN